jgi:integrase
LRASELKGLRWANIDLVKRELHVRERADEYNVLGRPKSGSGDRTVPLTPIVVKALREWKLECPKSKLDLVFPTPKGQVQGLHVIVKRGHKTSQVAAGVSIVVPGAHGKPVKRAKYPGLHWRYVQVEVLAVESTVVLSSPAFVHAAIHRSPASATVMLALSAV